VETRQKKKIQQQWVFEDAKNSENFVQRGKKMLTAVEDAMSIVASHKQKPW